MGKKSKQISNAHNTNTTWETLKIPENLALESLDLQGLIGLEVLENYDSNFIQKSISKRNDENDKRKYEQFNDSNSDLDSDDNRSKKKKKKQKNAQKSRNALSDNIESDSVGGKFVLLNNQELSDEEHADKDNNSSVHKLIGWSELGVPLPILRAIAENGFISPTQIQLLTIPPAILGRRDILGAAETGSGKTLAFGIPVLNGILELKKTHENVHEPEETVEENPLYALILTPTRELAVQIRDHLKSAAKYTHIKIAAIFGGLAAVKQERLLKKCPEIVIATPGRFWELLQAENPHLSKVDDIKFLVVDETDRMVEKGHFDELQLLLQRLNVDPKKKTERQNFIFSATLTMVHDLPDHIKKKNLGKKVKILKATPGDKLQSLIEMLGISDPKIIDITQKFGTAELLTECRIFCQTDQKDFYLYYFLKQHPGRTIVFCNSIDCVRRLAQLFTILRCKPYPLHANMNQKQRLKNLERFRFDPYALLIATDVAARGLDIPNIQHVIHYQVPRTTENYVHRSGRTARANNEGIAVLIMDPNELQNYVKLCSTLGKTNDIPDFPISSKQLAAVKDRVYLAREIDLLELKARRTLSDIGWREKTAEDADMIVDSDNESDEGVATEKSDVQKIKKTLKIKHSKLEKMLSQTLFARNMSFRYPTSSGQLDMKGIMGNNGTAIDTMKKTIQDIADEKKFRNKSKQWKLQHKNNTTK